jgi:hypothetical protein
MSTMVTRSNCSPVVVCSYPDRGTSIYNRTVAKLIISIISPRPQAAICLEDKGV